MPKETTVNIQTVRFIIASDLFQGLGPLWNRLADSEPVFCWGGNNRTLVDPQAILDHLDNHSIEDRQLATLKGRIQGLPPGVYVDFES